MQKVSLEINIFNVFFIEKILTKSIKLSVIEKNCHQS